jgi:dihydroneopterin aldolase
MSAAGSLWDPSRSYERVALEDVAVEIPVGIHAEELVPGASQRVLVTLELFRHRGRLTSNSVDACLDYAPLAAHLLTSWTPARRHTGLLEALAEELVELGLGDPRVEACRVVIRKPDIYDGRATPTVEVYRVRD